MLSNILKGAGAESVSYSDITVVTSGSVLGNASATFSPALQAGDVVFIIVGDNDNDYTIPAGYTSVTGNILTGAYRFACYYKVMGSTPDTGIALNDGNDSSGCTYYALRGVQTESPVIEVNYTIGVTSPTFLTPPPLMAPAKSLFLVAGFTGNGASAVLSAAPAGYTGFRTIDAAGSSDTYVGSAYKTITATGTETPGAFSLTSTAAVYGALSIVVRPYSSTFVKLEPAVLSTSTTQNSSSGTTVIINKPDGTIDGDLMVALLLAGGGTVSGWTGPAGWNEVADSSTLRPVDAVYWKTASGEGSSYTFTCGTSRTLAGTILTYRYAAYDAVSAFSTQTTSPTIPSVSVSTQQSKLISIVGYDSGSSTPTIIGMVSQVLNNDSTAPSFRISDSGVSKGPSGTRNTTTGGVNSDGIQLVLKPTGQVRPTISFVTSATAASIDSTSRLVAPSGIQAGDLLVWSDYVPNYSSGTVPSGFTQIILTTATAVNHRTAYKIADGTESGTTITGMTGTDFVNALLVFRGTRPFTAASFNTWNGASSDADVASQTVASPTVAVVIAAAGARSATANIAFTTQSPTFDGVISNISSGSVALSVGYKINNGGDFTQVVDVGDSGSRNTLHSGFIAVR